MGGGFGQTASVMFFVNFGNLAGYGALPVGSEGFGELFKRLYQTSWGFLKNHSSAFFG